MLNGVREYTKIKTTMFGLLVLLLCIEFVKAGMLCSTTKMNWLESGASCRNLNGKPVIIDAGNVGLLKQKLDGQYEVWASGLTVYNICNNGKDTVCGYSFNEKFPPSVNNELRFGSCITERNYICLCNGSYIVLQATHDVAIECVIPQSFWDTTEFYMPPGYYWRKSTWTICSYQYTAPITWVVNTLLCRVYNNADGYFYVGCNSKRHAICTFDEHTDPPGYTECFKDYPTKSTTTPSSTLVQPSTTKQLSSTKRHNFATTHFTTENNHVTDFKIPSTYSTSSSYKSTTDLGIKVGVPVASCVVLLGVVIFVVYMCRRYKRDDGDKKRDGCVDGQLRSKSNTNQLQPSNVITVTNETYTNSANDDPEEDEYAYISEADDDGTDQDMNTQSYERSGHFSMGKNAFDNEYSYSSDLHDQCEDGQYDTTTDLKRQQNKASDDYDRIQINKAFDRYGVNESELYDTSATNQSRPHCNSSDDYDHINIKRSDSVDVYDTTRPVGPVNETTGDIYNQLDQNDKDDTYDKTSHQQTFLMRPVVDDDMYA